MNNIQIGYEQEVAKSLLRKIKTIDPASIIAGGAPRDWFLGTPCKDLDVYLRGDNFSITGQFISALESLDLLGFKSINPTDKMYAKAKNLRWVFEGTFQGKKVNIMVMEASEGVGFSNHFSTSICKITFNGVKILPSIDFLDTIRTKKVKISEGYSGEEPHVLKMKQRFPEYIFVDSNGMDIDKCGVTFLINEKELDSDDIFGYSSHESDNLL